MAQVDITVVEESGNDNGFLPGTAGNIEGELRATSVKDMVQKVCDSLKKGDCIKTLDLVGHGRGGNISVGDGQGTEAGKRINGDADDWEDDVAKLKDKFCKKGGKLRLLGCNTGVCDAGAEKMHELANLLGVKVCGMTRSIYARDFDEDGFRGGDDDLVEVEPGLEEAPGCLTEKKTSGLKDKDKDKTNALKNERTRARSFGVHDVRRHGLPEYDGAVLRPFDASVALEPLLSLYDFSQVFDAVGLAADIDALIDVLYQEGTSETWELTLDYHGLVVTRFGEPHLFVVRGGDPGPIVEEYLMLQEARSRFEREVLGIDARGKNLLVGSLAVDREFIDRWLDARGRRMSPERLLNQPTSILKGVSPRSAELLGQNLGIRSVRDLRSLGIDSRFGRIAEALVRLAELEQRHAQGNETC